MATDTHKRLDLDEWLHDLRRLGGKARTLSEKHESIQSLINLADLQMLEEATKRIIVTLSKRTLYGRPPSRGPEGAIRVGPPRPGGGLEAALTLPSRDAMPSQYGPGAASPSQQGEEPARDDRSDGIIGLTESMRRVRHLITKAAACSLPVLIQGDSGTGKELVARAIHQESGRQTQRFFSENCSAIS